jgi:hypothetical protein
VEMHPSPESRNKPINRTETAHSVLIREPRILYKDVRLNSLSLDSCYDE